MFKSLKEKILRPLVKEVVEERMGELHLGVSNASDLTQEKNSEQEKQIIAEIMMSAGPRKEQDSGLGEDACGLLLRGDFCFFWISDGTSESPILEDKIHRINFSSRTLAQELGGGFRRQVLSFSQIKERLASKENVIESLLKGSLDDVMQKWTEQLNLIQSNDRTYLDSAFNDSLSDSKDFSSTFLCGVITTSGQLQVGCYGDSPIGFMSNNLYTVIHPKNYRFFMRLNREADRYFFSTSNDFNIESYCFDDVSLVIAGSDGVGRLPEFIKAQSQKFSFGEIRSRFPLFEPRTKDDKVLCILSLENF